MIVGTTKTAVSISPVDLRATVTAIVAVTLPNSLDGPVLIGLAHATPLTREGFSRTHQFAGIVVPIMNDKPIIADPVKEPGLD